MTAAVFADIEAELAEHGHLEALMRGLAAGRAWW